MTENNKSSNSSRTAFTGRKLPTNNKTADAPSAFEKKWLVMYEKLNEYKIKNGNCLVPDKWKEDPKLATWVGTQRNQYIKNKLSQDRIDKLNEIGFIWNALESKWEDMFNKLLRYKEKHGHCNVPVNNYKDDPKLGKWVNTVRRKMVCGTLPQDHIDKLSNVGFIFRINMPVQTFNEMYKQLIAYKEKHGNTFVSRTKTSDVKLCNWCSNQHYKKRKGTLPAYQEKLLADIGFFITPEEVESLQTTANHANTHLVTTSTGAAVTNTETSAASTSKTVTPNNQQEEILKLQKEIEELHKLKQKRKQFQEQQRALQEQFIFNNEKRRKLMDASVAVDSLLKLSKPSPTSPNNNNTNIEADASNKDSSSSNNNNMTTTTASKTPKQSVSPSMSSTDKNVQSKDSTKTVDGNGDDNKNQDENKEKEIMEELPPHHQKQQQQLSSRCSQQQSSLPTPIDARLLLQKHHQNHSEYSHQLKLWNANLMKNAFERQRQRGNFMAA